MALSSKDRLIRIIESLPDDAPFDEIIRDIVGRDDLGGRVKDIDTSVQQVPARIESAEASEGPVTYHLEKRGWISVLVPDRPVPPITLEMVNDLIEEMRREREDRWLGLTNDGD